MSTSDAELLDLVNEVIKKRLAGDAYNSYSQRARSFEGTTVPELMKMRDELQRKVDAASGSMFRLATPFPP